MRTIGLDFGTHQTKLCVEEDEGFEKNYYFFRFSDNNAKKQFVLPSIIKINPDRTLSYGYIKEGEGQILRYFKQATFTDKQEYWNSSLSPILCSIWYLAFILFDLEEKYGIDFEIQMGVPTDTEHLMDVKRRAVVILSSAYKLVEEIFHNDKKKFLSQTLEELKRNTEVLEYSQNRKEELGILVFPEAYACLCPLVNQSKLTTGMSLMIDVGGGTTDISFFTLENGKPQIYDFISVPQGLNFLTKAEERLNSGKLTSSVESSKEIYNDRLTDYEDGIRHVCSGLRQRIVTLFRKDTDIPISSLNAKLKNRPLVYTGGGSTFSLLRIPYGGYEEVKHVSFEEWQIDNVKDIDEIEGLCPILSTAYGLSIKAKNDDIIIKAFGQLFETMKTPKDDSAIAKGDASRFYGEYGDNSPVHFDFEDKPVAKIPSVSVKVKEENWEEKYKMYKKIYGSNCKITSMMDLKAFFYQLHEACRLCDIDLETQTFLRIEDEIILDSFKKMCPIFNKESSDINREYEERLRLAAERRRKAANALKASGNQKKKKKNKNKRKNHLDIMSLIPLRKKVNNGNIAESINSTIDVDSFIARHGSNGATINKKLIAEVALSIEDEKLKEHFMKKCKKYNSARSQCQ